MQHLELVPEVIPKAPTALVQVTYPTGKNVNNGNELTPDQVKTPPKITWNAEPSSFYTVAMVDPDAPSRKNPKMAQWQHWLVVNIPGNDISKGETLTSYMGAGPPKGTGLHRYVILVYKQPEKLRFNEKKINAGGQERAKFSIAEFAQKHKLGDPIAWNAFQSQNV